MGRLRGIPEGTTRTLAETHILADCANLTEELQELLGTPIVESSHIRSILGTLGRKTLRPRTVKVRDTVPQAVPVADGLEGAFELGDAVLENFDFFRHLEGKRANNVRVTERDHKSGQPFAGRARDRNKTTVMDVEISRSPETSSFAERFSDTDADHTGGVRGDGELPAWTRDPEGDQECEALKMYPTPRSRAKRAETWGKGGKGDYSLSPGEIRDDLHLSDTRNLRGVRAFS